jgi:hypothetical protein
MSSICFGSGFATIDTLFLDLELKMWEVRKGYASGEIQAIDYASPQINLRRESSANTVKIPIATQEEIRLT